jgi:hypothetical protein
MLVWISSYPRSGNTFLRMLLHRIYAVTSSVIYDIDGVTERLGPDLVGYADRPGSLPAMRASDRPYFVKTHRRHDADVDPDDRVICLVRDGRDATVSWARQICEQPGRDFRTEIDRLIRMDKPAGTSGWGTTVLSWLRVEQRRVLLTYEDLVAAPEASVGQVVEGLGLRPNPDASVPSFADLRDRDPQFFRRGISGTHRDELPEDLHRLFWSIPSNAEAMALLGYGR